MPAFACVCVYAFTYACIHKSIHTNLTSIFTRRKACQCVHRYERCTYALLRVSVCIYQELSSKPV